MEDESMRDADAKVVREALELVNAARCRTTSELARSELRTAGAKLAALLHAKKEPVMPVDGCTCYFSCMDDPMTGCGLSGGFHTHQGEPCPVHPEAPETP